MYCLDIWNKECFKQSCLSGILAQFLFIPESRVSVPCQSIELDKQASHSLQQEPEAPHPFHATGLASHSPWWFTLLSGATLVWPCMAFRVLPSWLGFLCGWYTWTSCPSVRCWCLAFPETLWQKFLAYQQGEEEAIKIASNCLRCCITWILCDFVFVIKHKSKCLMHY